MSATAQSTRTEIGHVHLMVADLERSIRFYTNVLGFQPAGRVGEEIAFLTSGDYHHRIGLNTRGSRNGARPPAGSTGLFHFAILYPDREALAAAVRSALAAGIPVDGARDHGVSEAVYVRDPDGIGIELYRDRPRDEWPKTDEAAIALVNDPLDLGELLLVQG